MSGNFTSGDPLNSYCANLQVRGLILNALAAVKSILTLPLCIYVLYLGFRRWLVQRTFEAVSHSDIFTYHLSAVELFWGLGFVCHLYGTTINSYILIYVGIFTLFFTCYGEGFFHVLTSVDRYLAVVHPITYLGLKSVRGVRIRNAGIAGVWLLSFGLVTTAADTHSYYLIFLFLFLIVSLLVVTFCSFSVLCVLIRPAPGQGGGERERVDQSKQRAFNTITAISSVLWFWFIGLLVATALSKSSLLTEHEKCLLIPYASWFNLPTSLVSPLQFLHRAGRLSFICCSRNGK